MLSKTSKYKYHYKKNQFQKRKKSAAKETSQAASIKIDKNHCYNDETAEDDQDYTSIKHINIKDTLNLPHNPDEDSIHRHEIERGSDFEYDRRTIVKRQKAEDEENLDGREQLFIKDGNAEILQLITRSGNLLYTCLNEVND